jgi:hypothetical protein
MPARNFGVCWLILGVLTDTRCADRYSMCWPRLGVLIETQCVDWYSVCWPILGVLTETRCADWYSVYWLILGVLTETRCAYRHSVCWPRLGVRTDTWCADRESVCWPRPDFLTETRCVETDVLPMTCRADWGRLFWWRLYIRFFVPQGKLQQATASYTVLPQILPQHWTPSAIRKLVHLRHFSILKQFTYHCSVIIKSDNKNLTQSIEFQTVPIVSV